MPFPNSEGDLEAHVSRVRRAWSDERGALGTFCMIGSAFAAEVLAGSGFDCIVIDAQHGLFDGASVVSMLQVLAKSDVTPLVRVPTNDSIWIGQALDAGAEGVIVPSVSSKKDAERAVAACRYPPHGVRSYGPIRARALTDGAEPDPICIVMIETADGVTAVAEICSTEGVDAVLVGPNDLALSLGLPVSRASETAPWSQQVLTACHSHGIPCGTTAATGALAQARLLEGYRLVLISYDVHLLATAARLEVTKARQPCCDEEAGVSG